MSAAELLAELKARGVRLSVRGDRVAYDAPAGVMTAELRDQIRACKPELLVMLGGKSEVSPHLATHADREWRRFLAVCLPRPDGRGWYDPGEAEALAAIAHAVDDAKTDGVMEHHQT